MNRWVWRFSRYQYTFRVGGYVVTRYLGFFSYWLIRWYHGREKLEQMGRKLPSWEK